MEQLTLDTQVAGSSAIKSALDRLISLIFLEVHKLWNLSRTSKEPINASKAAVDYARALSLASEALERELQRGRGDGDRVAVLRDFLLSNPAILTQLGIKLS